MRALFFLTLLAFSVAVESYAQRFQYTYGGALNDAAKGGVLYTSDGGFIAVGESKSFSNYFIPAYDVYVVKTDRCGRLSWSKTYDLGGDDFGRKIRQTGDKGYIIVGTTANVGGCMPDDIFLLKIDSMGNVQWAKTYGGTEPDEGWDVQLAGPAGGVTYAYMVAGSTRSFGAGSSDAFLMVTDVNGEPIWGRAFGGAGNDYFRSCVVTSNNEIIATGGTTSYTVTGDSNIVILRTNSSGNVLWSRHYGGGGNEEGWSIIEAGGGDLVVAGHTTTVGTAGDGYVLKIASNGNTIFDRSYGGSGRDEFREIVLDGVSGHYWVTGMFHTSAANGQDLYLSELDAALLFVRASTHGGSKLDQGWSITLAPTVAITLEPVMAGFTESFGFGAQDLYLIAASAFGVSGCNDFTPAVTRDLPDFQPLNAPTCEPNIRTRCAKTPTVGTNTAQKRLCTTCPVPDADAGGEEGLTLNGRDELGSRGLTVRVYDRNQAR